MDSKELKYGNDVDTVGQQQSEGKKYLTDSIIESEKAVRRKKMKTTVNNGK